MGCKECGKPKCNGECGCKSPKVLQINNSAEYITFHKVSIPAAMGDSITNPPKIGAYRNALVYYEADHTSWMYSTDGIPTLITGKKGETGDVGPQGPQGEQGPTGPAGADGESFTPVVVSSLPSTGTEGKLYLTPKNYTTGTATGNPITATVAEEAGKVKSFQLDGDTFQQTYTGKNLFNSFVAPIDDSLTPAGVSWSLEGDGTIHTSGTNSKTYKFIRYEITLPAGSYWFGGCPSGGSTDGYSMIVQTNFSDPNTIVFDTGSGNTFTLTQQTMIQVFPIRIGSQTVNMDGKVFKPIIVAGSNATDYEPYVGGVPAPNPDYPQPIQTVTGLQTITVNSTNYPLDLGTIELCKLGDYQDYIWKDGDDWKIHKATKAIYLKDVTWVAAHTNVSGKYRMRISTAPDDILVPANNNTKAVIKSSVYGVITAGDTYTASETGISVQATTPHVFIYDPNYSDSTSPTSFTQKMASTNATAYYALATATDTTITDQALIAQLEAIRTSSLKNGVNNITNIAIAPNLTGDMEIGYYSYNPRNRYDEWLWLDIDNEYEQIGG